MAHTKLLLHLRHRLPVRFRDHLLVVIAHRRVIGHSTVPGRRSLEKLYDSYTMSFIMTSFFAREVSEMPAPIGLLFTGLLIKTVLGAVLVAALVLLFWKIGKLADAYTDRIKA